MDGEIIIEGFSESNIIKCSTQFLGSREKCLEMLKQAKTVGISGLLHIPIVLLMVCAVFMEKKNLPGTKTRIVRTILELIIDRTTLARTLRNMARHPRKILMGSLAKGHWTAAPEQGNLVI